MVLQMVFLPLFLHGWDDGVEIRHAIGDPSVMGAVPLYIRKWISTFAFQESFGLCLYLVHSWGHTGNALSRNSCGAYARLHVDRNTSVCFGKEGVIV